MEIEINLQPKQKDAIKMMSQVAVGGYGGAKGGGKSFLMRSWQLMRRHKYPQTHGLIIRKTFQELHNTHIKKMFEEHPGLRKFWNESKSTLTLPNGSSLTFGYLKRESDVYQYQGVEFEDIGLDESTQHSYEVFTTLRTSLRTTKNYIKPKFMLTFNPGGLGHAWVKRLFIERQFNENEDPTDFGFVQAHVFDNAALMDNDPQYLKVLKALPDKKRKAYLEGDWNVFEGQFFEEWNDNVHVIEPQFDLDQVPTNYDLRLSWDEGTTKPRSIHLSIQDNDGRVHIVYEHYKTGLTASQASYEVKEDLEKLGILDKIRNQGKFVYDPSMEIKNNQTGTSTADVVYNILGIPKEPGNNSRLEGARRFHEFLSWNQFEDPLMKVWNTCPHFIRTIPTLVYAQNGSEDIDSDGEDHAYDDVRYNLMSLTRMPNRLSRVKQMKNEDTPEWFRNRKGFNKRSVPSYGLIPGAGM